MSKISELKKKHGIPKNKFGQTDWSKIIPDVPRTECVYGIFFKDKVVYIGTTKNLYTRLKRHFFSNKKIELSEYILENLDKITFGILYDKKCFNTENKLISIYQPIFNY
jgi:excinuclease UvrABC nuclease subunit